MTSLGRNVPSNKLSYRSNHIHTDLSSSNLPQECKISSTSEFAPKWSVVILRIIYSATLLSPPTLWWSMVCVIMWFPRGHDGTFGSATARIGNFLYGWSTNVNAICELWLRVSLVLAAWKHKKRQRNTTKYNSRIVPTQSSMFVKTIPLSLATFDGTRLSSWNDTIAKWPALVGGRNIRKHPWGSNDLRLSQGDTRIMTHSGFLSKPRAGFSRLFMPSVSIAALTTITTILSLLSLVAAGFTTLLLFTAAFTAVSFLALFFLLGLGFHLETWKPWKIHTFFFDDTTNIWIYYTITLITCIILLQCCRLYICLIYVSSNQVILITIRSWNLKNHPPQPASECQTHTGLFRLVFICF